MKHVCRCLAAIKDEEQSQFMKSSYEELIAAKKENVALQLESAYRSRINEAYQQVSHMHEHCHVGSSGHLIRSRR